jgi:UDP-N-acetylglucosamine 2-epimerase (non-hydrolysing)/GDP/UDP-N,N'-diacetylbacillosamine 2-epimerase (hydrolysing)
MGAMDYVDDSMVLFVINPVTLGEDGGAKETKALVQMVVDYVQSLVDGQGGFALLSEANGDRGGAYINKTFQTLAEAYPGVCRYMGGSHTPTLEQFREIVHRCGLVVGNSSMCLIEVPVLGKRSIVVGTRQQGRSVPSNAISWVDFQGKNLLDPVQIKLQLELAKEHQERDTLYGDGHACEKILNHIHANWNKPEIRGRS